MRDDWLWLKEEHGSAHCYTLSCRGLSFFFTDTATAEIYTLSLHDALPIFGDQGDLDVGQLVAHPQAQSGAGRARSEEHTSELQSQFQLVCRLLLEKKKHVPH